MKPRFSEVRDKLRFVRHRPGEDLDLELFPDFLIVGPQRTGTTWLHENLIRHPQVFMPEQKEIYYLNNLRTAEHHPEHLPPVRQDLSWYLDFFRPTAEFLKRRDAECLEQYGERYEVKVRGEGTATYAVALTRDPDILRELLLLNPDIKVMTMVRNPIDRAWSHAKKDLAKTRRRRVADVPEHEWLEFLRHPYQIACGHHVSLASKWRELLPPDRLFVGLFADVAARPETILRQAYDFLGIRSDARYVGEEARQKVNPTESTDAPPAVKDLLNELFGEEVERLRDLALLG